MISVLYYLLFLPHGVLSLFFFICMLSLVRCCHALSKLCDPQIEQCNIFPMLQNTPNNDIVAKDCVPKLGEFMQRIIFLKLRFNWLQNQVDRVRLGCVIPRAQKLCIVKNLGQILQEVIEPMDKLLL